MSAALKPILRYDEGTYQAFCDQHPESTEEQLVAYFTRPAYEQMEERWQMEHCIKCDSRVSEEEANEADFVGRDPLCEECRPFSFSFGRNDPDGYNDTPRSELE